MDAAHRASDRRPVVDTVWLARRLLGERTRRVGLATLAHFFGVSTEPCHRALPDARATAEILLVLIGLAQERGARSLADLVELAAPRARRLHTKRSLVAGAPTTPGVYVFRGAGGMTLYVGRARDLRARLRSYFAGERQRPAVEAALGALERVEWRETGSELEAALEELRLLRELRPRRTRAARGPTATSTSGVAARGGASRPSRRRWAAHREGRRAQAARALDGHESDDVEAPRSPRSGRGSGASRATSASRTRRACATGSRRSRRRSPRAARARAAPQPPRLRRRPGRAAGLRPRVRDRRRAGGGGAPGPARARAPSSRSGAARRRRSAPRVAGAEDADELRLVASFLRRPPPELRVARSRRTPFARSWTGYPWPRDERRRRRSHDLLRGPTRRGGRAQAVAARRGPRPGHRPAAGRAARRGAGRHAAAAGAVERFCKGIVDAVAPYVVAVKPQVAFFEALGSDGWRALRDRVRVRARGGPARDRGREALRHRLDGRAYAAAFLEPRGADGRRSPTR